MLHHHVWLGGSVALGALLLTAGTPLQAWSSLTTSLGGPGGGDPFAPVIAVVALTAWLVVTYLGAVAAVLLLARLPGATGAVFRVLGRLLAPALLRRTLELALGLSVVAGGLGLSTATANATTEGPGTEVSQEAGLPDLDWPLTPDSTPSTPAPAPAPSTATSASVTAPSVDVLVQPGDTLWDLAAQSLRAAGQTRPTAAGIAQAWPQWWSANRAVIGADPDLLLPGTTLTPPG